MPHSHLVIQHFLKQLEQMSGQKRDHRPAWLPSLALLLTDAFDPLGGVARLGSECEWTDDGWELRLYLGLTEVVGGKDDGITRGANFELDITRVMHLFDGVPKITWSVAASHADSSRSFVTIAGRVCVQTLDELTRRTVMPSETNEAPSPAPPAEASYANVRVKVYSLPPREATPAWLQLPDGTLRPRDA